MGGKFPRDAGHLIMGLGSSTPSHRVKPRASSVLLQGNTALPGCGIIQHRDQQRLAGTPLFICRSLGVCQCAISSRTDGVFLEKAVRLFFRNRFSTAMEIILKKSV
ncbi:hypothetical protein, unlikely [Trypanosoma brucei gambiense DAL972]|uniref:T. brucei spp.-specific protein n=1 Tax=Trypanosoma brucei gambiense (strain MHOM/CI/86/DAL972) TaxID=679716 RepID=C9ZLC9_TRYB9|nr:hypothetical protein, unlikely [Trypanosoma brucei gambiense DAL972]CBH10138.1 hypothetical protein, unlikely [Trypanosoma brucei gambiense DAL972]|eukprot:XP_011772428.1 hypothetical protein, unlikely [Trypanosoma brucei gambiense DAL972]